ncbi:hypothetical protein M3Y94_01166700 [Aphelenchoides besseyi]|nr:hypothetical protein M3Y94_01166700 [Aphelenchoides besseyi]
MTVWTKPHRVHRSSRKRPFRNLPTNNTVLFERRPCTPRVSLDNANEDLIDKELKKRRRNYLVVDVDKTVHYDSRATDSLLMNEERQFQSHNRSQAEMIKLQEDPGYVEQKANLVIWISDICKEQKADYNVFPLAIAYINRILAVQKIPSEHLVELALACVLIASKMKAPIPISLASLAGYASSYLSKEIVQKWEAFVVNTLKWNLSLPTCFEFFDQLFVRKKELHGMADEFNWIAKHMQFDDELSRLMPSKQAALGVLYLCWDKPDLYKYRSLVYETLKVDFYDLKEHLQFLVPTMTDAMFYSHMQGRLSTE